MTGSSLLPATNKHMSNKTILKALERMGYKGRKTGHGFRGSPQRSFTPVGVVIAAAANKLARFACAVLSSGNDYQPPTSATVA
jgi:hypothetical protein